MAKFTILHTFQNPIDAEIIKGKLQSEGIRAHVLDQNLNYTFGPAVMEGFRLQILEKDFLKANQILQRFLSDN